MARQESPERQWYREAKTVSPPFWVAVGFFLGILFAALLNNIEIDAVTEFLGGLNPESLAPEVVGIIFTITVIDYFNRRRDDRRLKAQLIREMGSKHNEVASRAVTELRVHGWLTDGSLAGADFYRANLTEANLKEANLEEANLGGADLEWADLSMARLKGANLALARLRNAKLQGASLDGVSLEAARLENANLRFTQLKRAYLERAHLERVDLWRANLEGAQLKEVYLNEANLVEVHLEGANLVRGNLTGVHLWGAHLENVNLRAALLKNSIGINQASYDERTILPDSQGSWSSFNDPNHKRWIRGETDMARYTNPDHIDFWEPMWASTAFEDFWAWVNAGKPESPKKANDSD